jgi:hypothetical protein
VVAGAVAAGADATSETVRLRSSLTAAAAQQNAAAAAFSESDNSAAAMAFSEATKSYWSLVKVAAGVAALPVQMLWSYVGGSGQPSAPDTEWR